jgi:hypothetical protein
VLNRMCTTNWTGYSCCFMTILQTITGLVDGVVKLIKTEFGYDLLDALMGFENAPRIINSLLSHSSTILSGKESDLTVDISFNLRLSI